MMLHIPQLLTPEELSSLRTALDAAPWRDGAMTAGAQASKLKTAEQLPYDAPVNLRLSAVIAGALKRNPMFLSAALPKTILPPRFNRYSGGGTFGNHVDSAVHLDPSTGLNARTDISTTVFLCDPDDYDGGELIIEDTYGAHEVKLPAGDAILYPSTSLHRVEPVTRGTRMVSVLWTQSMVRDGVRRQMLFDLDMTILKLRARLGDSEEVVGLTSHYHNLIRQWAEV
jgi:PKHD-type hydroxylase